MPDRYQRIVTTPFGSQVAKTLKLPRPEPLRRYEPGQPLVDQPVLVGGAPGGRLLDPAMKVLSNGGVDIEAEASSDAKTYGALLFDASGITDSTGLRAVYDFFHPVVRRVRACGRVIILATPPAAAADPRAATAQRGLEGFMRSLGKETRRGATVQVLSVGPGGEDGMASTLRFLLSAKSAYVSGQVVEIAPREDAAPAVAPDAERPLADRVALVTGAARGIGASIAATLARDGAHVICLDLPAQGQALAAVANRVGGSSLQADITDAASPERIAQHLRDRHGGVDIVVHNAGITRDKTLAGMDEGRWDSVIDINLSAQERMNDALLTGVVREQGRIVCVSSLSGIAGNRGQTNYAASKAGVIGMVEALAPRLDAGRTINAVAPGFIETEMTDAMPLGVREAGRRMSSLRQGGLPVDVAETVAWLAQPGSTWVNGRVVRVCGQSLLGA